MGHCKDCAHWNADAFKCEGANWVDHYPEDQWSPGDDGMALAVMSLDDQGLEVGLKTAPMFGCTKSKSK